MVFQSYTLFPWLTVRANVEFALKKSDLGTAEKQEMVAYYIDMVGLRGFEDAYPRQLSGGMQQRVAIARALVYHPSVLLMDEPFGALDAQTRGLMQELLLSVWEKSRCTIVFVTHDVDEAIFMSDHVYIMTARPGRMKRSLDIHLPRPRSYEIATSPEFAAIKREIVAAIREETLKTMKMNLS
jgi:ABC-type nitrate/sulfonate/bicarbonate transport system ATPase subunit